jgi:hypothetical protein
MNNNVWCVKSLGHDSVEVFLGSIRFNCQSEKRLLNGAQLAKLYLMNGNTEASDRWLSQKHTYIRVEPDVILPLVESALKKYKDNKLSQRLQTKQ